MRSCQKMASEKKIEIFFSKKVQKISQNWTFGPNLLDGVSERLGLNGTHLLKWPKTHFPRFFFFYSCFWKKKILKKTSFESFEQMCAIEAQTLRYTIQKIWSRSQSLRYFFEILSSFSWHAFFCFAYNLTMCCEWAVLDVTITSKHMGKTPSEMALGRSKELGCGWRFGPFFSFYGTRHELK